ncbi:hypothetical protein D9611_013121 [Ephemerocybe angulata]|uniref:ribonuclease H n=1 Tax=Ephemerocybe angulata TaxID=980116 RepID=A0A8H5FC04_9AGAR|nr:hypothetical protein D9611_013121 [Tulosesus angulatus]
MPYQHENSKGASRRHEEPRRMEIVREWKIDPREGVPVCRDDDCPKCRASLSHHADIPKHKRGYIDEEMTERWKKVARGVGASEQEVNSLRRRLDESSHTIDRLRDERDEARQEAREMREDLRRMQRELDAHHAMNRAVQPGSSRGGHGGPRSASIASRSTEATTRVEETPNPKDADIVMNDDSGVKGESAPSKAPQKVKSLYERGPDTDAEDSYSDDDNNTKAPPTESPESVAQRLKTLKGLDLKKWTTSGNKAHAVIILIQEPDQKHWFTEAWKIYESARKKPLAERTKPEKYMAMYLERRPLWLREKMFEEKKGAHLPQLTENPKFWAEYLVLKSEKCKPADRAIPGGIIINDKGALSAVHITGLCLLHGWQPSKVAGTSADQLGYVHRLLRRTIACPGLVQSTIDKHRMPVRLTPEDPHAPKPYPTNGANDGVTEMARWLADRGARSWNLDLAVGYCQEYIRDSALKYPADTERGKQARDDAKWVSRWMVNVQSTSSALASEVKLSTNWIAVLDSEVKMREVTAGARTVRTENHLMPPGEAVPAATEGKATVVDEYTHNGNLSSALRLCSISIRVWNIKETFALKMGHPEFRGTIEDYDINIFQEVRLHRDIVQMVGQVDGFTRFSVEREYYDEEDDQWGGVMAFVRTELGMTMNERLSSADIMVLESRDMVVVGAYILPGGSEWSTFTDEDPFEKLLALMWVLKRETRPVLVMGDINARTESLGSHEEDRPHSADKGRPTTRGRALVGGCRETGLTIMNGLRRFGGESGAYTSHHTRGKAVVDYAMGNAVALGRVQRVIVGVEDHEWSDHAQLVVVMEGRGNKEVGEKERDRAPRVRRRKPKLPEDSELDRLVVEAMKSRLTLELRLRRVYGSVYCATDPVQVYVDGSALRNGNEDARAGSGVFYGRGSGKNEAVRVPDNQTNNRAELYAVLRALEATNDHRTLVINSDSEYAIDMLTTYAAKYNALGWRATNGDVLRDIAYLLRQRPAATTLRKVKAHSGHEQNDAADSLAKEGATKPPVPPYEAIDRDERQRVRCQCDACARKGVPMKADKVVADFGRRRGYEDGRKERWEETEEQASASLTACRRKCRERQKAIREELFGGEEVFWDVFERLKGSSSGGGEVDIPIGAMGRAFWGKMNPGVVPPSTFDTRRQEIVHKVAALMGDTTDDRSPLQSFDRYFEMREIEEGKADVRTKLKAAKGVTTVVDRGGQVSVDG